MFDQWQGEKRLLSPVAGLDFGLTLVTVGGCPEPGEGLLFEAAPPGLAWR